MNTCISWCKNHIQNCKTSNRFTKINWITGSVIAFALYTIMVTIVVDHATQFIQRHPSFYKSVSLPPLKCTTKVNTSETLSIYVHVHWKRPGLSNFRAHRELLKYLSSGLPPVHTRTELVNPTNNATVCKYGSELPITVLLSSKKTFSCRKKCWKILLENIIELHPYIFW